MTNLGNSPLLALCRPDETPRVWSFVVTIFGDLAQDEGAQLSGGALQTLCTPVGIRPEALRVALHRLRKDGWLVSTRAGRGSLYALSPWGRDQARVASPRIYGTAEPAAAGWLCLSDPNQTRDEVAEGIAFGPRMSLRQNAPDDPEVWCLDLSATQSAPTWVSDRVCPPDLQKAAQAFYGRLQRIAPLLDTHAAKGPEAAIARVLLVHDWRRIALKAPDLPLALYPTHWRGPACQALLTDCLSKLPAPQPETLNASG